MRRFSLFAILLMSVLGFSMNAFGQPTHSKSGTTGPETSPARHSSLIKPRTASQFSMPPMVRGPQSLQTNATRSLKAADADVPTIYGSLIFSYDWNLDNANPGMFSFPASAPLTLTKERGGYLTEANGGGTYANNRYYIYYYFEAQGVIFNYWRVFDTDTWECLYSQRCQESYVSSDMTYDRTTGNLYGCYYNFQTGSYYFGKSDPEDGTVTVIATWDAPLFTLAADVNGDIYGIDYQGNMVKVNKETGSTRRLGNTGVVPAYTQSMAFDFKTNRLYWAATTASLTGLYEIDMQTYKANLIGLFDAQEEFAAIYIMNQGAAAKAPGELQDFNIEYRTDTANEVNVSFKLPTESFDGTPLSGKLDWTLRINDDDIDLGDGNPGDEVNVKVKSPTGYAVFTAFATNANGDGPESRIRKWIGKDSPMAPSNLRAEEKDGQVILTWDAPTESQHGGYFDPSTLSYKIYRSPGDVLVCESTKETTFTDKTVNTSTLSAYHYKVVAYAGNLAGGEATSGKVLTGNPFTPPYREDFSNVNNWDLFTVLDCNSDGKTWIWEAGRAKGQYTFTPGGMDDWLITPQLQLSAMDYYNFIISCRSFTYTEVFEVKVGKAPTPEAMTTTIIGPTNVNSDVFVDFSGDFIPEEDGVYYIGIHHISPADRNILYVQKIELTRAASVNAPAEPQDLTIIPGEKGALRATVKMKAPTTDLLGNPISSLSYVTVYRGNRIAERFNDVTPGEELSYDDTKPVDGPGKVSYRVFATNESGDGRSATATKFIGPDKPGASRNIHVTQVDGKAYLTWDAPTEGENGGYIDPETLKYHIQGQDFVNGGTPTLAMNLTTREFWDEPEYEGQQGMAAYYVYAENSVGIGYGYRSNVAIMGTPYALPFVESFKNNAASFTTWRFENHIGDSRWGIAPSGAYPACIPADNDGGMISFEPAIEGATSEIISGLIDISKAENPIFEFYYYYNRLSADKVSALVSPNGYEFTTLATADFSQMSGTSGWRKMSVSLNDYKEKGTIQIAIGVEAGNDLANIHVDNIIVRDMPAKDLAIKSFSAPALMKAGESADLSVVVENLGAETAASYTVTLYRDDKEVASQTGSDLKPYETAAFSFSQTADQSFGDRVEYYATVTFDGDNNSDNNRSDKYTVGVAQTNYPTVTDLMGSIDETSGTANLSWSAPDLETEKPVTDGFETYQPFIINNIGDWLTNDRDRQYTVYVQNEAMWPHAGEQQAYIVFNPAQAGLDQPYNDGTPSMFLAHDSEQMLICFASDDDETANDDWLISPRLNGKAQTISFYVKSLTDYYGKESYEVYATTSNVRENISSFKKVKDVTEATESWTQVSVKLPEGTTYFAIRCVSKAAFGFCIDDITYIPAVEPVVLLGYDVYCNDSKLNSELLKETGYKHVGVTSDGSYIYNVVCVYDKGESAYSNALRLGLAGIEDTVASSVKVFTSGNRLYIQGASGLDYTVNSLQGFTAAAGTASEVTALTLDPGVYVVTVGQNRYKVIVK